MFGTRPDLVALDLRELVVTAPYWRINRIS
jgi:hypothetical protein